MTEKAALEFEPYPSCYCPECRPEPGYMEILLFMGIEPDGYVCRSCKGFYAQVGGELKRLATVIG